MRIIWIVLLAAVAVSAEPDSTGTQPEKPASSRLITKVVTGTIAGAVFCVPGALIPNSLIKNNAEAVWFDGRDVATVLGGSLGYVGGVALGVRMSDPESSLRAALLGSSLGYVAGIGLILGPRQAALPVAVLAPVVGAVVFSELSRRRRLSVDVSPAMVTARWRF